MKKTTFLLILAAMATMFFFAGCKKNEDASSAAKFELEHLQYYPLEVAQIKSENINLTDTLYSGTINGQLIQLRNFAGQLVFFVPDLPAGNYEVKFLILNVEYTLPLKVAALTTVPDPDALLQASMPVTDSAFAAITRLADSLQGSDKTAVLNDLQTITGIINNIYARYNSLNPAEKQEFARMLAANQWWLDEVTSATFDLLQDVRTYKNQAVVLNYEDRVTLTIFRFETALTVVLLHIPKVALLVGGGALLGSIVPGLGTGLGAALGAGVGIGFMLSDVQLLMASIDRMVNTAMLPTDSWFCNKTNDFVGFTSMIAKTVNVNMTYRTVYNADANTTIPIAQKFIKGMADFRSGLNTISQYLPASLRQSKVIQSVTNYKTLPLAVNSQQLSVSDISNSNVSLVSTDKTDGNLALRFKNSSATNQSFSFKLTYNNSSFGNFSRVIDANITASSSTVMDYDGNIYDTVRVGNQTWLKQNLHVSHFNNGDYIPQIIDDIAWSGQTTAAACSYLNGSSYEMQFGKLYNWFVASDSRKVCPAGWHVPSQSEFATLQSSANYLDIKSNTTWYCDPLNNATNSTGFSLLAGGQRYSSDGSFHDIDTAAYFWTKSIDTANNRVLLYYMPCNGPLSLGLVAPANGYSIRCVKD